MPGYSIITYAYPEGIPWELRHLSTDNLTVTNVFYTDNPDINSFFHFISIMPYRVSETYYRNKNNISKKEHIVALCPGVFDIPDWLTSDKNGCLCYIHRHVHTNKYGKVYHTHPMLYRTETDARRNTYPCSMKDKHHCEDEIVQAYICHAYTTLDKEDDSEIMVEDCSVVKEFPNNKYNIA